MWHPTFIKNITKIKKAAARVNGQYGYIKMEIADAIVRACEEVLDGKMQEDFITLKDVMLADDVDLEKLTDLTDGYSCAEIYHRLNGGGICNLARNFAGRRWVERIEKEPDTRNRIEPLRWCDFEEALQEVTPSSVRDADRIAGNEKFRDAMSLRKESGK